MITYLVGGAVRDRLLDLPVTEKDWVVVGETPDSMMAKGFKPVGKDFPVFLHPDTHEEYALARTERKTGPGYRGFAVYAAQDVTLEEDLKRRDLTINAMAIDSNGVLIDPYHGRQDLEQRVFRHVSPAFNEDPVRILRVARFAARYQYLGFSVATETQRLMAEMVSDGEVEQLIAERIWAELYKALQERAPVAFFRVLKACGALAVIFPELEGLFGVPQPERHHPEIDTGVHCLMVLEQASLLSDKPEVRLAALLHDLGKGLTPRQEWPSHRGHEQKGLVCLEDFCRRLRVPKAFKNLSRLVMQYHTHCHRVFELRAATLVDLLQHLNAFSAQSSVQDFVLACEADMRGRTGFEERPYPQADYLKEAARVAAQVDTRQVLQQSLSGPAIGEAIRRLRIQAVQDFKSNWNKSGHG